MKNWLTQVVAGLFALATLASCEKDEVKATVTPSNSMKITASTNSIVLLQANEAQIASTYTWNSITSFSMSNAEKMAAPTPTYQIQFAKSAESFGYNGFVDAGTSTTTAVTVKDMNTALLKVGLAPGISTTAYARVAAVIGTDAQKFHSEPVAFTVTPYQVCLPPNTDVYSIIGPAGIDWNTDVPLVYNCVTKTYDITRALNADEFKFRLNAAWTTNYGSSVNTGGPVALNGGNIKVATAGTYTIKLDVANLTYTIIPQ
ncbi:SusE domain-containing protein [Hymenobacter sp. BT683]|uniref:SusE domain-containing protein n=1 Tax=Hymenobacter jeongseonensis TaxID=2791027 RepID=A0ABS0IHW9_9BACT|nr:SusE domain-containing protein [Hymenobacter jeongseonensis]MBF9237960.1 SusE domain-containing protein [Hymenobacter jeongseonensis]